MEILFQMLNEDDFTVQMHVVLRVGQLLTEIERGELNRYERILLKTFESLAISQEVCVLIILL